MAAVDVEPTPYDVVYEENKLALRRYRPETRRHDVPIVIAYAFINTPAILDLEPERSVVRRFLERGFEVYLIDWGFPSRLDASLTLDDYVGRYLANCVDAARDRSGSDAVHLLGYSTGAPLVAAYAALHPEDVRTLSLLGPPLDFDAEGGMFDFGEIAGRHDPERLVDVFGNVPAPLLDAAFSLRKPVEYAVTNPLHLWEHVEDERYVEHYARRAKWAFDGPDLAGATYRGFVEELLERNALIEGELTVFGEPVRPDEIDAPVLLIVGRDDAFVPLDASLPFLDVVPSDDTDVVEFPTGHVGLSVAPEAHVSGWPRVCDWLEARS
ncbi:alpha/beta fold hydrolase [Halomarina pelagica]|uniref:alpha/beta fold hydrolase n=1 Tax=Halomarina pelagica TaxID=2961599 RepID=UPI0020C3F320|nr:alpha/beta fold hydrolase [Halomarina sp. BND7]